MERRTFISPLSLLCLVLLYQGKVVSGAAILSGNASPDDNYLDFDVHDLDPEYNGDIDQPRNNQDNGVILSGLDGSEEEGIPNLYNSFNSINSPYPLTNSPGEDEEAHSSSSHISTIIASLVEPTSSNSQSYYFTQETFPITQPHAAGEKKQVSIDMHHLSIKEGQFKSSKEERKKQEILLSTSSQPLVKHEVLFSSKLLDSTTSKASGFTRTKVLNEEIGKQKENQSPTNEVKPSEDTDRPLQFPYRIPFSYVMRGSNEDTYKETGNHAGNANEMSTDPFQIFDNGGEVILQRRNRSKRDAPEEDSGLARNTAVVEAVESETGENYPYKSAEAGEESLKEGVKNAPPPTPPTNPLEALQRLTRLLERMLRELSQFQQKFTLRLIRMTERQDIDQMQEIMKDFEISPEKPIFFIAGGLKILNDSLRLALDNNVTQPPQVNEIEGVSGGSPVSVETTIVPILIPQEEVTSLPVEPETESPVISTDSSDMVIVTNGNTEPPVVTPLRHKRSIPEFDDIQVYPVSGRSARTENPYDDLDSGWIDYNIEERDDDFNTDGQGQPDIPELLQSPSDFTPSNNTTIDQSHEGSNDVSSSGSKHAIPILEEKAHAVPLLQAATIDTVPLNDSIKVMKEAERSNDHLQPKDVELSALPKTINLKHSSQLNKQIELDSKSIHLGNALPLIESEHDGVVKKDDNKIRPISTEDKSVVNDQLIESLDDCDLVTSHSRAVERLLAGSVSKQTAHNAPDDGIRTVIGDDLDIDEMKIVKEVGSNDKRAIASVSANNELSVENPEESVPDSKIAVKPSGLTEESKVSAVVGDIEKIPEEKVGNQVGLQDAIHLEVNPSSQLNTRLESDPQIKDIPPTAKIVNPVVPIENLTDKQVPVLPIRETTGSGIASTNAPEEKRNVSMVVENLMIPNPNIVSQDIGKTHAFTVVIPVGSEGESGRESLVSEQVNVVGRESVMKKVEHPNIEGKVAENQETFHAPTAPEESQIIGNNNESFSTDKAVPNAIPIHDNHPEPIASKNEADNGVRNTVPLSRETLGMGKLGKNVVVNESIPVPLVIGKGVTSLEEKVFPVEEGKVLTKVGLDVATPHSLGTPSPDNPIVAVNVFPESKIIKNTLIEDSSNGREALIDEVKVVQDEAKNPILETSTKSSIEVVNEPIKEEVGHKPTPGVVVILNPVISSKDVNEPLKTSETEETSKVPTQPVKVDVIPVEKESVSTSETIVDANVEEKTKPVVVTKVLPEAVLIGDAINVKEAEKVNVPVESIVQAQDREAVLPAKIPVAIESTQTLPVNKVLSAPAASSIPISLDVAPAKPLHEPVSTVLSPSNSNPQPVAIPIALVIGEELIPTIPDLDSAFGQKPIDTTPNIQLPSIPGLRPSIPERPVPEYIDFVSQGVDMDSLYFHPPQYPVIVPSPPVFSGYSPSAMMQRHQYLMNNYFSGLFYRRTLE